MPSNRPKVAVLLAAYNGMAYIEQQIESILNQEAVEVSIFISVDLSDDITYEWCCKLSDEKHSVFVLPYGEKFGGAAANFFRLIRDVDFSKYDYVALADQDDIWLKDKLSTGCSKIEQMGVDAYSSNVLAFWENGKQQLIDKAQPLREYDYLFEAAGPGCTYIFSSRSLQGFKQQLTKYKELVSHISLHDWLLYAYYRASGYKWIIDSDYKMLYRQHGSNEVGVNSGIQAVIKRIKLFRNGWYKNQVSYISRFVGHVTPDYTTSQSILKNIRHLRRKPSDRVVLFFFVLLGFY